MEPSLHSYLSIAKQYLEAYIEKFNVCYCGCDGEEFDNYNIEYSNSHCDLDTSFEIVIDETNTDNYFEYYYDNLKAEIFYKVYGNTPTLILRISEHTDLCWSTIDQLTINSVTFNSTTDVYSYLKGYLIDYAKKSILDQIAHC